jgi:hypothetical protein
VRNDPGIRHAIAVLVAPLLDVAGIDPRGGDLHAYLTSPRHGIGHLPVRSFGTRRYTLESLRAAISGSCLSSSLAAILKELSYRSVVVIDACPSRPAEAQTAWERCSGRRSLSTFQCLAASGRLARSQRRSASVSTERPKTSSLRHAESRRQLGLRPPALLTDVLKFLHHERLPPSSSPSSRRWRPGCARRRWRGAGRCG